MERDGSPPRTAHRVRLALCERGKPHGHGSFWIDRQAIYPYSSYREGEIQYITSGLKLENLENQRYKLKDRSYLTIWIWIGTAFREKRHGQCILNSMAISSSFDWQRSNNSKAIKEATPWAALSRSRGKGSSPVVISNALCGPYWVLAKHKRRFLTSGISALASFL